MANGEPFDEGAPNLYFGYSRKSQRAAFNRLRHDYQKATGKNLCEVVDRALKLNMEHINELDSKGESKQIRTSIFRGLSYVFLKKFCEGKATD